MRNPLESEEVAFRFVLGTLVYLAPIVIAAWIATWLGVIVFVVMSGVAFVVLRRGTTPVPATVSAARSAVEDTHRMLVVTDSTRVGPRLREEILRRTERVTEDVLLICAVAASPLVPGDREAEEPIASEQLETALQELRSAGINARGTLVDGAPLRALEDALGRFDADEVLIAVSPSADEVVEAVRLRFGGPVTAITEHGPR